MSAGVYTTMDCYYTVGNRALPNPLDSENSTGFLSLALSPDRYGKTSISLDFAVLLPKELDSFEYLCGVRFGDGRIIKQLFADGYSRFGDH